MKAAALDAGLSPAASETARRHARANRAVFWIAVAVSLLWIAPFYYAAITVFKSGSDYVQGGPLALPASLAPVVDNIVQAWIRTSMASGMLNSLLYGTVGAGAAVLIAASAAFGLARLDVRGRAFWFLLIFSGTIFPFQIYLIPLFQSFARLGLLDTRIGLLLVYIAICIPFPTLVLKNYMGQLPRELDEAARMDGCSEWRIFRSIVLPNCRGPLIATFLLQFNWIWNDLVFSMVLTVDESKRSIMNSLMVFQGNYAGTTPNLVVTATVLASLPTLGLFFLLRRYFMQGLALQTA
ncbi:carbohydrate ABC transporter permease [Labrys wisconsinensis]|uniref:Multiple sugar transport system permease protein n=1 Tax=Labrys wisconsinensis TaxID=425677 RepID=A0ABU0J8W6_9HYPH|nr:carbohydrate ABC transporter permease [Labrys wisconsinensis]MDQ0469873.1 multiple sugar transport system permease protein [Labrys wisconsinensis]